jgi:hypothetical protein
MPRNVTVTLDNGETLEFKNVPDDVTPDAITARAQQESGGAAVVKIDGGRPAAVATGAAPGEVAAPVEETPVVPGEDIPGYEQGLREYYQELAQTKGAFDPSRVQDLASKYGVGTISNLPEIEEFYKQYGTLNPTLSTISSESMPPPTPKQDEIVGTVPQGSEWGQRARAFGKGFLYDFADEMEAAARALASGNLSADEYYRIKTQINDDYNAWAAANPGEALALEATGGIASTFIPGVGLVGRGVQAATGLGKITNLGVRAAGTGALSGALSGLGQAETMSPSDLASSAATNALFGAAISPVAAKGFELTGRGLASGAQRLRERFGDTIEVLDDATGEFVRVPQMAVTPEELRASQMLYEAAGRRGPERAVGEAALASRYGAPTPLGLATPRMTALTEKVVQKPSSGQEALAEAVYGTRAEASERVGARAEDALPGAKDYFGEEEAITQRLRDIGDTEYQRAYAVGEVADPTIYSLINNPASTIRSIWQSAQNLAKLKGSDLRMRMEPVLDEGGNLVGLAPTKDSVPNVEALDLFKRALDDRIEAGFKGRSSEGKSEAAALRDIRNALVTRMDDLVPEYREARTKYAGDMEVRDALRFGLDIFSRKIRPAEFRKQISGMSDAEREAVKSGALEAIFRNIEGSQGRDLAKQISGTPEKLAKLKDLMGPAEAKFFERAMRRESDLYQRTSKVTGGSRTAPMAEGMRQLDEAIQGGNLDDAVAMLTAGPVGRMAIFARWVSTLNPRKEFGDKVYTQLSKALSAQKPEELREVLDMLRRSKSYADLVNRTREQAAGRVATVAGATLPSAFEDRGMQPPPFAERDLSEEEAMAAEDAALTGGLSFEAPAEVGIPEEVPTEETPEEGTVMMGDRAVVFDASTGQYKDAATGEIVSNFAEGGSVQQLKKGGPPRRGYDYANAARTVGQGLTFGFGDEIEAKLRSLASRDPNAYANEVKRIRMLQERYAKANPGTAMVLEGAGMLGGSLLAPSLAGVRAVSNAGRVARLGAGAVDALGQGALYSAGKAKPDPKVAGSDRMSAIRADAPRNAADFAILSGAGAAGKRLAKTRAGQAAINFAARPVRYAVKQIRR